MRKIDIQEPNTIEWKKWRKKCEKETEKVIKKVNKNEPWEKKNKLYNEQKKAFYFKKDGHFFRKCVYCETKLKSHDDLDHYRPAKEITNMNHKKIDHPGYYWLTYNWLNLLPSCKECNSKVNRGKETTGKGNRFPVKDFRAKNPSEEIQEEPLLVNPTLDNPADHFEFCEDTFKIVAKNNSEKGNTTCKILGFHEREELWQDWKNAYNYIYEKWGKTFLQTNLKDGKKMRQDLHKKINSGECAFSFVKQKAMEKILKENKYLQSEV